MTPKEEAIIIYNRCYFGEGGWCDSWYTSIHPEKGTFTFNDIVKNNYIHINTQ